MRFLKNDTAAEVGTGVTCNNVMPAGAAADNDLTQLYVTALERQLDASQSWRDLMDAHIHAGSSWSAVLHCAEASGLPPDRLRVCVGAPPSTLSRWFNGLAQPAKMLRNRLDLELGNAVSIWVEEISARLVEAKEQAHIQTVGFRRYG